MIHKKEVSEKKAVFIGARITLSDIGRIRAAAKIEKRTLSSFYNIALIERADKTISEYQKKQISVIDLKKLEKEADSILGGASK
jgi:uncharacterized protein (DUF1778 family)